MDEDDDYIFRGTPLRELDDDAIIKKKPNQDLTVRDEKGRQRFHGAFTGGFSAGYFNSVGTKEGWEPATFVSSRSKKASSSIQQNPEDYMDEEDFGQYGIAPKRIHTTTNFRDAQTLSSRKRTHVQDDEIIPGEPPLRDLIKPVTESIGMQILKHMGWRQGQGIGPRVKKKMEPGTKVYGCSMGPLASSEIDIDDPMYRDITIAPDDAPEVPYTPKDNYHGIGYSGLSTQSVLGSTLDDAFSLSQSKSWLSKDKKKLSIRGQAFGVGAFEDEDDDIYYKDDMSQYDFSEFEGSKNKKSTQKSIAGNTSDKYSAIVEILEGFTLAQQPVTAKKYFPPPQLPPNFKPLHKIPAVQQKQLLNSGLPKPKLGHIVRSIILGEKKPEEKPQKPPQVRRSRFDVGPLEVKKVSPFRIGSSTFKPFSEDTEKQARYEEFTKMNCNKDHLKSLQPLSMTEWERHQEIDEFAKAAVLYQPLSKALGTRFESRSHLAVELTLTLPIKKTEREMAPPVNDTKDVQPHREVLEWHPASLLCKRFNVPNPYPDSKYEGVPGSEKKKKPSLFDNLFDVEEDTASKDTSLSDLSKATVSGTVEVQESRPDEGVPNASITQKIIENILPVASSVQEMVKGTKPPMDLFKEIFQTSSDDDSDSEKDNKMDQSISSNINEKKSETTPEKPISEICDKNTPLVRTGTKTTERKGFGVFANLDLDALNKRTPSSSKAASLNLSTKDSSIKNNGSSIDTNASSEELKQNTPEKPNTESTSMSNPEDLYYGPAPPPAGSVPVMSSAESSHHKHSKHKHKQHKHKLKKKKKKVKRKHSRKDSDDSSTDCEEDIPTSRILEKLKILKDLKRTPKK